MEPKTPHLLLQMRGCFVYIISTKLMTTASKSQICGHIRVVYSMMDGTAAADKSGGA